MSELTEKEIDEIILENGFRNAGGGIYKVHTYDFARAIAEYVNRRASATEQSWPNRSGIEMFNDPDPRDLQHQAQAEPDDWFRVEITDFAGQVVAIESEMLAGREIGEGEEKTIQKCIAHLQGFIGPKAQAEPVGHVRYVNYEGVIKNGTECEAVLNEEFVHPKNGQFALVDGAPLYAHPIPAAPAVPEVTNGMAIAFHRALTDGDLSWNDCEEIKIGLRAVMIAAFPEHGGAG